MKRLRNLFKGDPIIWWCFLGLSIISAIAVYSSISMVSKGSPTLTWLRHMGAILLSWGVVIAASHVNYRKLARISKPLLYGSIALLIVVLIMPHKDGESARTLIIHGRRLFQPSEIAKIALVISMAKLLTQNTHQLNELGFFLKLLGLMAVVAGLIVTENFSTAALVSVICFLMMFFGGVNTKYWWRTLLGVGLAAGLFLTVNYIQFKSKVDNGNIDVTTESAIERSSTWAHRVYTWVQHDPDEYNQVNLAHMAAARGGLTGVGPGNTVFARINQQMHSDFIFSLILEEGGFLTGLLVFMIYAAICARCIKMANRCKGTFGSLLLGGLGTYIFFQAIVHISYNVGVIPVTGQTLPLISHGGTSYVMFGFALGIIQSVSNDVRKKERAEREAAERQKGFEETFEIAKENA